MFTQNVNKEIGYDLRKACFSTFKEVIKRGLAIEKVLIEQGIIKLFKENKDLKGKDKPRFWNKNKNIVNDVIVNVNIVRPKLIILGPGSSINNQENTQGTSKP